MGVNMREDKLGTCARHLAMAKRCSVPQNTLILTSKAPISKNYATFLKPISFWDTLYKLSKFWTSSLLHHLLLYLPPTSSYLLLLWFGMGGSGIEFLHDEISMLFCSGKFYGGGGDIAIIARSRSRSLRDLRLRLLEFTWTWTQA